ncbi:hypothetical protein DI005_24300 [Prauserella sp. PE36]|uniref:DUF485 domain-containing protein n=1 Tax=Prauserella endophytica TaxID=1592324 RepID=A0ABY2RXU8_9PSEU|nr:MULTISPECIES: DUF485 domain-containing protein [Prauserella]PXY23675.1 hypothetical protein BAY59_28960 [Prauserella coralliicola]RBM16734.1 hypothetical protein DI005_24300 [Prauserella sp. PE36]TKG64882.1 DUF485 domain-containing protein [Prauserella endophytica]
MDERTPRPPERHEFRVRRRIALAGGALTLVVYLAIPALTAFTTLFDGHLGPVGLGYVAAAFAILFPLGGAYAYCRWANRREGAS